MHERISEKTVSQAYKKVQKDLSDWESSLSDSRVSQNAQCLSFAQHMVEKLNEEVKNIETNGPVNIAQNLSVIVQTVGEISGETPLSEAARILSEKHPDLPKTYGYVLNHIPNRPGRILDWARALVMNYQTDPHCYDNCKSTFSVIFK